uniref:Putative secreted protein n=1 Tax=Hyalomma excavatum TaxID=257692 RepID=A0A131XJ99_9ACAR
MSRLLLVSVLAVSLACVASYQRSLHWGRSNLYQYPYTFGGHGYGGYSGQHYGIGGFFHGPLGGLSVYDSSERGYGDGFGYRQQYNRGGYYYPSNGYTGGWHGQQQLQQQHSDW